MRLNPTKISRTPMTRMGTYGTESFSGVAHNVINTLSCPGTIERLDLETFLGCLYQI